MEALFQNLIPLIDTLGSNQKIVYPPFLLKRKNIVSIRQIKSNVYSKKKTETRSGLKIIGQNQC